MSAAEAGPGPGPELGAGQGAGQGPVPESGSGHKAGQGTRSESDLSAPGSSKVGDAAAPDSGRAGPRFPDALKKAVASGISALFVTEEGIRSTLSDMRLPKDAMGYLAQQTDKTRRELSRVVSDEVKGFMRNADVAGALRRALVGLKVQVRAEIKFGEDEPDVAVSSRVHRRGKRGSPASPGDANLSASVPVGQADNDRAPAPGGPKKPG